MRFVKHALLGFALASLAAPALSQATGYDGENFVKAIHDQDNAKAIELLEKNPLLVNTRTINGDTALIFAIQNQDTDWTGYLLKKGADPNLAAGSGETPLIAATRQGFQQAAEWLLQMGAKVDGENKMGETPLIVAVQRRNVGLVKLYLSHGANPDKPDAAAGYSARDYAKRDSRNPELLRAIEDADDSKSAN